MNQRKKKRITLILGPSLWILAILLIPPEYFTFEARSAIGTILWMGSWWVTLPVAIGVTAFLPIAVNAFINMVPMSDVLANFGSETVILLLGAEFISITWEVTGLDKRISLKALCLIGPSLWQQIIVWFLVSAILSMFLPNAVVCAMLTPIALSMLRFIGEGDLKTGKIAPIIVMCVAWGAGIGGMGTPLGGAMNLVAVSYFEEFTGNEYMYVSWFAHMIPLLAVVSIGNILCLMTIKPKKCNLKGSKEYFHNLYTELPSMNRDEMVSFLMFLAVILLSFGRSLYAETLPWLKPAYVFLCVGMLGFVISLKNGDSILTWEMAEKKVFWGMIFMFAGGMAAGTLLTGTGATVSIANQMAKMNLHGGFETVIAFTAFTIVLSEISNNTSAAAIAIPIVIGITEKLKLNPVPYIYTTIAAFNCAFMLPTTIRAIPVGMGLSPGYLMKKGALLTVTSILIISIAGYLMMQYWPYYSMV